MTKQKIASNFLLTIFLFLFLRFSQYIFSVFLTNGKIITNNFFNLAEYKNYGLAFGLPLSNKLLIIISFLIVSYFVNLFWQFTIKNNQSKILPIILIISGAMSNLIERIKYGYVLDYLEIGFLPVFNLADFFITAGIIWFIINYLKKTQNKSVYKN